MEHRRRHVSRLVGARRALSPISHRAVARNGDRVGVEPAARSSSNLQKSASRSIQAGARKLGLADEPDAVAVGNITCSQTLRWRHVEWIPESETKSWVRYLPPRWIFDGTAVCGIQQSSVGRCFGWHGHNGISLGNPRLGFVATSQTTDGQPGLVGYYIEEDHDLDPDDRVRFRPGSARRGLPQICPLPRGTPFA